METAACLIEAAASCALPPQPVTQTERTNELVRPAGDLRLSNYVHHRPSLHRLNWFHGFRCSSLICKPLLQLQNLLLCEKLPAKLLN
jgi:hypothetical protein